MLWFEILNLKCAISFGSTVLEEQRSQIQSLLHMSVVDHHVKYLGLPAMIGKSKKVIFNFLKERLWKKLKGWKEKLLSRAGKELIKAVTQALPYYIMRYFLLPKTFSDELQKMINRLWWGDMTDTTKIHWLASI